MHKPPVLAEDNRSDLAPGPSVVFSTCIGFSELFQINILNWDTLYDFSPESSILSITYFCAKPNFTLTKGFQKTIIV